MYRSREIERNNFLIAKHNSVFKILNKISIKYDQILNIQNVFNGWLSKIISHHPFCYDRGHDDGHCYRIRYRNMFKNYSLYTDYIKIL